MDNILRIYLDTSVIGGCFDKEFASASNVLFSEFDKNKFIPLISETVAAELENAPEKVKRKLKRLSNLEIIMISEEMKSLAGKYLKSSIVTLRYADDALHIAAATIAKADVLVSWNFKHIVNLRKIQAFNAVNLKNNYAALEIRTPKEVIDDEK
jgi:predicted nucleic acid-binding protein